MELVPALIAAFIVTQVAVFSTTVYLHRALAHKAINISPQAGLFFRFFIWVMTGIAPRGWVAVHRKHHAFSDTEQDPHSPIVLGFWAVQLGNVKLYRQTLKGGDVVARYSKDLPPDRLDRMFFDHAWMGLTVGITFMCVVLGLWTGLLASLIHMVAYLGISAAVNAIGHTYGRRPNANLATNNQWLAWISGGEGLHNNHHAAPTAARFSFRRSQLDPGWWLISAMTRLRLATVRHEEIKLKQTA
jgi:stearoyl-CoA desaturase (Delta-9 desaturase)